ncbi:MAG: SCO family protein [Lysobacter sp.]|nr:SCO family protein [Lysobacter sp.]
MKRLRPALAFLLMVAASAFAAQSQTPLPKDSVYQLPMQLTDQHGKSWDWRGKRGEPQVVAMFYTSCPYICPLIVDSGKAVEHALTPAERARLGILLISMDPKRDTPAALLSVASKRKLDSARWSLASPKADAVRSVAGVLGVRYRALADGEFNHTSALVLLDRDGRIVARTEKIGSRVDAEFLAAVRVALAARKKN